MGGRGGGARGGLSILKKRLTAKPAEEKSRARGTMRASASIFITLIRLMLNKLLHRLKIKAGEQTFKERQEPREE